MTQDPDLVLAVGALKRLAGRSSIQVNKLLDDVHNQNTKKPTV